MSVKNQGDMAVITAAKDLCSYIFEITDKSPKKFRFTLTNRLQTCALDVIDNLITANEVYMGSSKRNEFERAVGIRHSAQKKAMTKLKILDYIAQLSMEQGCILPNQYKNITKKLSDCRNLLGGWSNSDQRRLNRQFAEIREREQTESK